MKKKPTVTKGRSSRKGTGLYSVSSGKAEVENIQKKNVVGSYSKLN